MDGAGVKVWLQQRLGYVPSKDQLLVERLQDIQNTPPGQPMMLKTLAELQNENRARLQQEQVQQDINNQ